ncbi:hypothetical protein GCM10009530_72420 [Microbispora corallina]|uniref:SAF domain-containing protein n=1 Tax=Microbispora corallina TaxID=83302 RepID=A0ABQ4G4A8_9ACTN|nr:hypothetical protein [Microbispora corallina]GIH41910.1 hypothetical protein Mco01_49100 [Microbispora corallina]
MRVTDQPPFRSPEAQRLADQTPQKPAGPARRLPVSPRERKPALAALAVLLIVGGALLTVTLVLRSGDRVSAIEIKERVGAGQLIPLSALKEVQIAQDGPGFVYWSAAQEMTRYYAAVDLVPGTLLNQNMISSSSAELVPGRAVVGLSLKSGQVPPGLEAGQRVQVIYVPGENGEGQPKVLAHSALVNSVSGADPTTGGGNVSVSVVVSDTASPIIAAWASSGRIALAYLPGAGPSTQADVSPSPEASASPGAQPTATAKRRKETAPPTPPPAVNQPTGQPTQPTSRATTAKPTSKASATPGGLVDGQG